MTAPGLGKLITLAHGSGGQLMHKLISDIFRRNFDNEVLNRMSDSAIIGETPPDHEICFTTDSYTVSPIEFPGGDIGKLAVCGTVNDLAVEGATPRYLSCGVILEEGLEIDLLEKIVKSMARTAREAGVYIATGDLKVVEHGNADKIFINTAGVGFKKKELRLGVDQVRPGDRILINGPLGLHGVSIMAARELFNMEMPVKSDCDPLNPLIEKILEISENVRFMRDPTRGGLATTLNEVTSSSSLGIEIHEDAIPVTETTKAACEILGFDPLYLANEGKVIVIAGAEDADVILDAMSAHPLGKGACVIGEVVEDHPGKVILKTTIGGGRILDMLSGEQLPRIC